MGWINRIRRSNFVIKLRSWEYWPFGIVQAPLFIYWLWLSLKARSLLFFSASNPGIFTGGMFGESKFAILEKIPEAFKPKCFLVRLPATPDQILQRLHEYGISLPVICKPDLGERGWMVKRISSADDLQRYLSHIQTDFIVQEFVDLPMEFSVFYMRHPQRDKGKVTSITMKEMLTVTGDGVRNLGELIMAKDRAKLQWEVLKFNYASRLTEVPAKDELIELVSIGNHCLGTTFINRNDLITEKLNESFNNLSERVEGFYFGRYDLRTASFQDLENGNVKIMELNGCGAEPSHIYHPGGSLRKAIRDLFTHWRTIYEISTANHKRGTPYLPLREGIRAYKKFKAATTY